MGQCAIFSLLDDLIKWLEFIRVTADILDCNSGFLSEAKIIGGEWNMFLRWAITTAYA
jgi:hypothetical protein